MATRLVIGEEDLAALRRPFDRAAELSRKPEHERLLGIGRALCAEATAQSGATTRSLCSGSCSTKAAIRSRWTCGA